LSNVLLKGGPLCHMCCLFNDHALLSVLQKFLPGFWGCLSTLTIDLLAHDMHAIAH
jgi:hypothetical protein